MTQPSQSTQQEVKPALELDGGQWLQGDPIVINGRESPTLIDFWDYTCLNCLRTLPYLREWHHRYSEHGLAIVGVHTPEFSFAGNADHVQRAIKKLDIPYPVVLDSEFNIWKKYENSYWPAKYFVDRQGMIRARHFGEGGYSESETFLQVLLREQDGFSVDLPEPMAPIRPDDAPGAVCYRVTPEIYCGYSRGLIGNVGMVGPDTPMSYADHGKHIEGAIYLEGDWLLGSENVARPFGASGVSLLRLEYTAADINLVLHPPVTGDPGKLRVLLDGESVTAQDSGADVIESEVTVDEPRMYHLLHGTDVERHSLTLETESDGLAAFTFTFTSCVAPQIEPESEG